MTVTRKIVCPSCKVGLKVAATVPPGKRIRCPKCASAFAAPAAASSAPVRQASAVTSRPAAPRAKDNEDVDRDEERPAARKRSKKKKKQASNRPLVLGLGIAGAVLLLGAAVTLVIVRPWETKKRPISSNNAPVAASPKPPPAAEPVPVAPAGNPAPAEPASAASPASPGPGPGLKAEAATPAEKGPAESDPMKLAAGRKVFESLDCSRCHAIGGSPGGGFKKGRGPSLARVGADPAHTVEWLSEQIRDPRSHRPGSRMPPYQDKISREDLRSLAEYLASLK